MGYMLNTICQSSRDAATVELLIWQYHLSIVPCSMYELY